MATPDAARILFCCGCGRDVVARLTHGLEVYPHRPDLIELPFWICDQCGNFVGCHHKTKDRTRPLGCIPTPALRGMRQAIHKSLDRLWKGKKVKRSEVYARITKQFGREYHTADVRSLDEAQLVLNIIEQMKEGR